MSAQPPTGKGRQEEAAACRFLEERGLVLRERNYRCRHGEIDLIMEDGDTVVFVEVRFRAHRGYASGAESVDRRKQTKLAAAAAHYLQGDRKAARRPARFDVVGLAPAFEGRTFQWIKNAFLIDA